jgi:hypothetical protein
MSWVLLGSSDPGVRLGSSSGQAGVHILSARVRLGSAWGPPGVRLGSACGPPGSACGPPGSACGPPGIRLGSAWDPSGVRIWSAWVRLGSARGPPGVRLGRHPIQGSFWGPPLVRLVSTSCPPGPGPPRVRLGPLGSALGLPGVRLGSTWGPQIAQIFYLGSTSVLLRSLHCWPSASYRFLSSSYGHGLAWEISIKHPKQIRPFFAVI